MNRKPIGGSISSSSYPLHLIIFSVGIIILFLGLLYEFISILNLHHVLQEKEIEIHQLSSELLHQTQQESLLELDIKNLQEKVSLMNQLREKRNQKITEYLPYDLRDVLYLSKLQTNSEVMQEFKKKWQVTSPLYETCGVVQSILPPTLHPSFGASNPCKIAIVSSWFPRPCGIATHSHMLYDGITDVCPTNSQIDILAIRNTNESPSIFPSEVKRSFSKSSLEEYNEIANYINQNKYHAVIIGYEFGLFEDEYLLCLLRHIQTSYTQVITILHTLADNLPYQKQALTQQVK